MGRLDCTMWLGRSKGVPLEMRVVALRKPPAAIAEARRKARLAARKLGQASFCEDALRQRMGDPGHLADATGLFDGRSLPALSHAMAHRARLQAAEKLDRPTFATSKRSRSRKIVDLVPSSDDFAGRTARGRVRRLSLLSTGRALLWRAFRQIVLALLVAITPQPNLATLQQNAARIRYRMREPPRRRRLQSMPHLPGLALS